MTATTSADVVVLGAGPAGLMAALQLARRGRSVVVVEQSGHVGGMAGSFEVAGIRVDYGSHRLHPVVAPRLRDELAGLLSADLQERRRRGRINVEGTWVGFPLRLGDLARNLPRSFTLRVGVDTALAPVRRMRRPTAYDALVARLGPTVANRFYVPYLTKLWGAHPSELAVELADRRVSARSGLDVVRRALRARQPGGGTFLYPRRGFGQFSDALADAASTAGADIRLGDGATAVATDPAGVEVRTSAGRTVRAALAASSIPVGTLATLAGAPGPVGAAASRLRHRAMVLVYLVLATDRLTAFDAHYFPGLDTPVSRLSEPKNFRDGDDPAGVTVVCAEVACDEGDATWAADAAALGDVVTDTLTPLGFSFGRVLDVQVRRIPKCYPAYDGSYVADLATVEDWVAAEPRLVTFGRQGLFAPDNTHHALHMGWELADAVRDDASFDDGRWAAAREAFRRHVVED